MRVRLAFMLTGMAALAASGCADSTEDPTSPEPSATDVTWSGSVRALVEANCTGCHFTGGSAPFAFETFEDVSVAAPAMLAAMQSGRMPPWPADESCRSYANERLLSADDLATFETWVEAGTPEGDVTDPIVIERVPFAATHTATAKLPYTPDLGSAGDDYRCFLLDIDFDVPTWVEGTQVIPDTPAVHHVLVYALSGSQVADAEQRDAADEGEGYTCFGGPLPNDAGGTASASGFPNQIGGWVPGAEPAILGDGAAIPIAAGSRLVMQMHYSAAGGAPQPDLTTLEMRLTETPPATVLRTVPLVIPQLDIPAGANDVTFTKLLTNWSDKPVTIRSMTPHMHQIGKKIGLEVVPAAGEEVCGVWIPDWDFDWQLSYEPLADAPLVVGPGDSVRLTCAYDNTPANQAVVDGQQLAPRDVTWGDGSLDEMCLMYARVGEAYSAPPADSGAGVCAPVSDCYAASDRSLTALLACEETSSACATCPMQAGQTCGMGQCMLSLVSARECITDCILAVNAFGGSADRCMRETCGEAYQSFLDCADPIVQSGSCDDALATTCGLAVGSTP